MTLSKRVKATIERLVPGTTVWYSPDLYMFDGKITWYSAVVKSPPRKLVYSWVVELKSLPREYAEGTCKPIGTDFVHAAECTEHIKFRDPSDVRDFVKM